MHQLFPNWINGLSTKRPDSGSFCRNFSFCDPCEACSRCNFTSCSGVSRNPNGDPAFPRSHSGASHRVRKHYTAECVAPHRRHRTPRFGCLNPNGAAPEPVDVSAAPIRSSPAAATCGRRGSRGTPFQHPSVAPSHIAPPVLAKSMFLPVIDGGHDALLCT